MPLDPKEFDKELEGLGQEDTFTLPADRAIVYLSQVQSFVEYVADNRMVGAQAYADMQELVKGLLEHKELNMITVYHDVPGQKLFIGDIHFDYSENHWGKVIHPLKMERPIEHINRVNKLVRMLNAYDEAIDDMEDYDDA